MPKVSAIVPCYNTGRIMLETIESLKQQLFKDIEIIIIDDGSTEPNTLQLLEELEQEGEVKVVRKENGGSASARNAGIREAIGEYIFTLDSDDIAEETYIQKAVDILDTRPEVGVVSAGVQSFGASDVKWIPKGGRAEDFLVDNNATSSSLFRKECWDQAGGFDEKVIGIEDWEFWINVTNNGWTVEVIPEYLFLYRKHANAKTSGQTKFYQQRVKDMDYMLDKHASLYQQEFKVAILGREQKIAELVAKLEVLRSTKPSLINRVLNKLKRLYAKQ